MPTIEELTFRVEPGSPTGRTVFLRTSWMFEAEVDLGVDDLGLRLRRVSAGESADLADRRRKASVFARFGRDRDFYAQRIRALSGQTVLDVRIPGPPRAVLPRARSMADAFEQSLVLAAVATLGRRRVQRQLGVFRHRDAGLDVAIGPGYAMRSSSRAPKGVSPINVDAMFVGRFQKLGLPGVLRSSAGDSDLSYRLCTATSWLFEAGFNPNTAGAVVNIATALEALLVAGREPPTRSLSERSAFLLADLPQRRERVSRAVKRFYDARGDVVHGSRGDAPAELDPLLDDAFRVAVALASTIAANDHWKSMQAVIEWTEARRWGSHSTQLVRPLPWSFLQRAVERLAK